MKRQLIILSGQHDWALATLESYLDSFDSHQCNWVKENSPCLLGQEIDVLVLDCYQGLNPDLLGQAIGALRGGGVFFILAPTEDLWPDAPDSFLEKIQSAYSTPIQYSRFIKRFSQLLNHYPEGIRIQEGDDLPQIDLIAKAKAGSQAIVLNTDQQEAVDAVKHVVTGHRRRPVVLTSDRGRGKSAAFGIAAAQLIENGLKDIVVTGPTLQSVNALFSHAALETGTCQKSEGLITIGESEIRYFAPDILLRSDIEPELVLVDEAAAIPVALLQKLLTRFPRIAFATTVHGYEGTGQGFTLRFSGFLDKNTRGWRKLMLNEPIRWDRSDPLEQLIFDLLLMNAEPKNIENVSLSLTSEDCEIRVISPQELIEDESALKELFGLLVLAHYRTRPFDLRYLLDAVGLTIYVMTYDTAVVGTLLVNREGGLGEQVAQEIQEGVSRPHGHLLPEILASHCGLPAAASMTCARVMRIAIHPSLQRKGLGSALLNYACEDQRSQGIDYIGSSFGATAHVLKFWKQSDFMAVKVGINRGAASGEHSIAMLKELSPLSQNMLQVAIEQFDSQFLQELTDAYQGLDPAIVATVLLATNDQIGQSISKQDRKNVESFCKYNRMYEACSASLSIFVLCGLSSVTLSDQLTEAEKAVVITRVLQQRSWSEVARMAGLTGRKEVLKSLQSTIQTIVTLVS